MLCMAFYLMVKHWVYWKYQYNKYIFNFIDLYIVIPVSGCVGKAPVHCFAGKPMMLLKRPCAALTWMKSYLNDRTQRVAVGSVVSNSMNLQCGVPQSYVLGPRLYCIFAKPIREICRRHNFSHHSYADETQVYLVIKPLDNWKNISRLIHSQ